MSNDNGDRRRVSDHYPTLDTEQLIKPINGIITYFQSVSRNYKHLKQTCSIVITEFLF